MARDDGSALGDGARRKTLDEIRRDLDQEFASVVDGEALPREHFEETASAPDQRPAVPRHGWRAYVVGGVVGCIVGQLMVVAYFAVTRDAGRSATAPLSRAHDPSTPAVGDSGDRQAGTAAVGAVTSVAPEPIPGRSARGELQASHGAPVRPSVPTLAPRGPDSPAEDWLESQAQLRLALTEWLALSDPDDDTQVTDVDVVLGSDGLTAKTRVPRRSAGGVAIREQRWERGQGGWIIVEDRELARARR